MEPLELVLDVETDGVARRVEVGLALDDLADVAKVIELCGIDALLRLAAGEWVEDAAKAILWVNVVRALGADPEDPPFTFEDSDLDWGDYGPFMVEPDPEMEATLAEASKVMGEEE